MPWFGFEGISSRTPSVISLVDAPMLSSSHSIVGGHTNYWVTKLQKLCHSKNLETCLPAVSSEEKKLWSGQTVTVLPERTVWLLFVFAWEIMFSKVSVIYTLANRASRVKHPAFSGSNLKLGQLSPKWQYWSSKNQYLSWHSSVLPMSDTSDIVKSIGNNHNTWVY